MYAFCEKEISVWQENNRKGISMNNEANYVGGIMENDYFEAHTAPTGRVHFEAFKKLLKDNKIYYEPFKESKGAQILDIPDAGNAKCRVYFTGGTNWWGFQKVAVSRMKKDETPCFLLIYAGVTPEHYWWIDLKNCNSDGTGRWFFSEPSAGKLQAPEGFSGKRLEQGCVIDHIKNKKIQSGI